MLEEGGRACPRSKRRPCVDSKNVPVYAGRHHAHMLKHMCAWCRHARGRFESAHGVSQRVTAHSTTTPQPQIQPQRHTHDNVNDTQRHQLNNLRLHPVQHEQTHQVKTRQGDRLIALSSFSVWWCKAVLGWCSYFLVNSVLARDLSLLNSVKYDSFEISVLLGRSTVFYYLRIYFLCSYSFFPNIF